MRGPMPAKSRRSLSIDALRGAAEERCGLRIGHQEGAVAVDRRAVVEADVRTGSTDDIDLSCAHARAGEVNVRQHSFVRAWGWPGLAAEDVRSRASG